MNNKRNRGGRNPKLDPAINRYSVNFSSEEDMRFLKMFDRSGMTSKSAFIKARIFGEPFHVVTFDKSQHEYYAKLSEFHSQFRMVGDNYNQTLKELKSHFSERRTRALVCKLEKYMMQLVHIIHKVVERTDEYQEKVQKSGENNIKMRLFAKYLDVVCVLSEKMSNFVPRTIGIHYGQRH